MSSAADIRAGQARYIIRTRFARVWQLLLATGSPVVALDANSLVRRLRRGGRHRARLLPLSVTRPNSRSRNQGTHGWQRRASSAGSIPPPS